MYWMPYIIPPFVHSCKLMNSESWLFPQAQDCRDYFFLLGMMWYCWERLRKLASSTGCSPLPPKRAAYPILANAEQVVALHHTYVPNNSPSLGNSCALVALSTPWMKLFSWTVPHIHRRHFLQQQHCQSRSSWKFCCVALQIRWGFRKYGCSANGGFTETRAACVFFFDTVLFLGVGILANNDGCNRYPGCPDQIILYIVAQANNHSFDAHILAQCLNHFAKILLDTVHLLCPVLVDTVENHVFARSYWYSLTLTASYTIYSSFWFIAAENSLELFYLIGATSLQCTP